MFAKKYALLLCLGFLFANVKAPATPRLSVAGGISRSGINTYVTLGTSFGRHTLYIGPKLVVSQTYLPGTLVWGGTAGYTYGILAQRRWATQFNLDYQNAIYPSALAPSQTNYIHELGASLMLTYSPVPRFLYLSLSFGGAGYMENYYSGVTADRASGMGITPSLRLWLTFAFGR